MKYNFDIINDRYNTGSYKYDCIKASYPFANKQSIIMTMADMDFKTADPIIDALTTCAKAGIYGYMSEEFKPYKKAVSDWFLRRHNLKIDESEIIYANGTIQALNGIINIFLDKDDACVLSCPVYGHFMSAIKDEMKRQVLNVPLINNNGYYTMDYQNIKKTLADPKCKIYLLCSPHNPVGRVWSVDELEKLITICHETNTILVSDEVHCDILRKGVRFTPILNVSDNNKNIISLTSIGKTFNASGLQCCNIMIKDKNLFEIVRNNFDRDINTFALHAAIAAYQKGDEWVAQVNDYIDKNIDMVVNYIKENMPYCEVYKPEGTYFLWLNFKKSNLSNDLIYKTIFERANVILQCGSQHDKENGKYFYRMTLPCPNAVAKEAIKRIDLEMKKEIKNENNN